MIPIPMFQTCEPRLRDWAQDMQRAQEVDYLR